MYGATENLIRQKNFYILLDVYRAGEYLFSENTHARPEPSERTLQRNKLRNLRRTKTEFVYIESQAVCRPQEGREQRGR